MAAHRVRDQQRAQLAHCWSARFAPRGRAPARPSGPESTAAKMRSIGAIGSLDENADVNRLIPRGREDVAHHAAHRVLPRRRAMIAEQDPSDVRVARRGDDVRAGVRRPYRMRLDRDAASCRILDRRSSAQADAGSSRGRFIARAADQRNDARRRIVGRGGSEGDREERSNALGIRNGHQQPASWGKRGIRTIQVKLSCSLAPAKSRSATFALTIRPAIDRC